MIPFVRMLQYGNEVLPVGIRSYDISADGCIYLVDTEGNLYASGLNQFGIHGTGVINDTVYPFTWKIINTGVDRICANGSRSLVQIMLDGRVLLSGQTTSDYTFGALYPRNNYTFLDITASMPIPANEIKYIKAAYYQSVLLAYDGRMWFSGTNCNGNFGDGIVGNQTSYKQSAFSTSSTGAIIKDVYLYGYGSSQYDGMILHMNDDTVFACGSNTYKQVSSGSANLTVFTQVGTWKFTDIAIGDRGMALRRSDMPYLYYCGLSSPVGAYNLFMYAPPGPTTNTKEGCISMWANTFTYRVNNTRNMYGGTGVSGVPIAPNNNQNTPSNTLWRTIPVQLNTEDYVQLQASRELMLLHLGTGNGDAALYACGTLAGTPGVGSANLVRIPLPKALGGNSTIQDAPGE